MSDKVYEGKGQRLAERGRELPGFPADSRRYDPKYYEADEGLTEAVNVALTLGQPLLLTGEPGCGKTQLAQSVAWELGLELFEFHTKSTSTYRDLLYNYDFLRHFQDVQLKKAERPVEEYVEYGALGKAIRLARQAQRRSVVLIDEVDKAPRDLPNDILHEIERMEFTVKETDTTYRAETRHRPIVVLTSNQEKDLPDAFRRRCVFYYIPFPKTASLRTIVRNRLPEMNGFTEDKLIRAIDCFLQIRETKKLDKNPSTAELIAWIELLNRWDLDPKATSAFPVLAKSEEDVKRLKEILGASG
jgi:MoxR-like ATPase